MDSHAAAMIKRFREGKPMSRTEREKENNEISEMWWIDKNDKNFTKTDDSEIPRNSPIKPMNRNDLRDPIKSPVPARRTQSWNKPVSPPRRPQRVDDLISDEIEDEFISRPILGLESPYSRPKLGNSYDHPLDLLGSLRLSRNERLKPSEEKSYRFKSSLRFDDDLDVYRSLEKNHQLTDSVDTLGTIGFKSLLAPNLKLDGKAEAPAPKQEGAMELAHLTTNLETLLRSFKVDQTETPMTVHDVPQTISQVTNQLNSDMLNFMSHYQTKYTEEEIREKEQKERDSEMKKLGKHEAQVKMIMDSESFNLFCEEMQSAADIKREPILASLSTDERILKEIEQNIKHRRIVTRDRFRDSEDGKEDKEVDMYRHNLYHRQWPTGPHPYYHEMGLSELTSNLHLQRTESIFRLHQLDPRSHWQQRQVTDRSVPNIPPEDKYHEEDMPLTGIDVLSFPTVNHRSITTAARDTISCCLNATMTTLALRLPGEEENKRQITLEEEIKKQYEEETKKLHAELDMVKQELSVKEEELLNKIKELTSEDQAKSIPPETLIVSSPNVEHVNHVKEEDLKKLEDLLGPEEKDSNLLKEVLKKKEPPVEDQLMSSQKRNIHFHSAGEMDEALSNRGSKESRIFTTRYVIPSKASTLETVKPSAPELPRETLPSPPSKSRLDSIPRHEREAYLHKMKNMRKKLIAS